MSEPTAALPVEVTVAGAHASAVRSWLEGVLGWQVVEGATAELVPAVLRIVDVPGACVGVAVPPSDALPTLLLVVEEDDPVDVARAAARLPGAVPIRWPSDRERLASRADEALGGSRRRAGARCLRVGGSAGGVGTSTVALALAGLAAWRGAATLVVLRPGAPVPDDVRRLPARALAAADLWARATALPGVPGARAVTVVEGAADVAIADEHVDAVVVDAGADTDVDVLVCRCDAAGLRAAAATVAAAVVVIGAGPASEAAVERACGDRRRIRLPRSARVARAGLLGRVPTGLPGSWVRPLVPLAPVGG